VDELTATIRDALLKDGASPATALFLATDFAAAGRKAMKKERDENLAQELLPFGRYKAAREIGCSPNHVYKILKRAREVLSKIPEMDDAKA
jgi:hypothetical protein